MVSAQAFVLSPSSFRGNLNITPPCVKVPHVSILTTTHCEANKEQQQKRRRVPTKKPSSFANTIDDLTMKRMGRGTIYYGERASTQNLEEEDGDEEYLLKPDPVLVTGSTGRTGQWIALGLLNQRFNVRSFSRSLEKAEKLFGPSGSNLDAFEGDLTNAEQVLKAVEGSIAIICAAGAPWWLPGGFAAVDVKGVENLVNAALKAGTVSRFVLISSADGDSARGKAKRSAEDILIHSGLPYAIIRAAELVDTEGGIKTISMTVSGEERTGKLSRVDLAQAVCQTLVYDRTINQLNAENPDAEFDFPNCVVSVKNGKDDYIPDKRFWKREFNRISDAHREKTEIADVENLQS